MPEISPQAFVDKKARIAPDVSIGAFSVIGPDVRIGPACRIDSNVTIVGRTELAGRSRVFSMAAIGLAGPGEPEGGQCVIGEANEIREQTTIYAGTGQPTRIGKDNLIMVGCQVGPGALLGDHGIFANLTQIGPGAVIEDYVRTSAFTFVDAGVTVGAYTFTAGYVEVNRDAPPYAMLHGSPFRVRGVNTQNLKRCGFGEDDIRELKAVFRDLFNSDGMAPDLAELRRLLEMPELGPQVRRVVDSLRKCLDDERGDRA